MNDLEFNKYTGPRKVLQDVGERVSVNTAWNYEFICVARLVYHDENLRSFCENLWLPQNNINILIYIKKIKQLTEGTFVNDPE